MDIPCKNCIVFALCNVTVKKLEGIYKTKFIINKLLYKCSEFSRWYYRDTYYSDNYNTSYFNIEEFCKCYKIKKDIYADMNLVRHLTYKGYK